MATATQGGLRVPGVFRILGLKVRWMSASDHTVQMLEG